MFSILVVGHGLFAYGMDKTVELIMGNQEKLEFENYEGGMALEEFEKKLEEKILKMGNSKGTLILADIKGGTPFNTGVLVGARMGNIRVIGGCNLPMIVEAIDAREGNNLDDAVSIVLEAGKNEIAEFVKSYSSSKNYDEGL